MFCALLPTPSALRPREGDQRPSLPFLCLRPAPRIAATVLASAITTIYPIATENAIGIAIAIAIATGCTPPPLLPQMPSPWLTPPSSPPPMVAHHGHRHRRYRLYFHLPSPAPQNLSRCVEGLVENACAKYNYKVVFCTCSIKETFNTINLLCNIMSLKQRLVIAVKTENRAGINRLAFTADLVAFT